MRTWVVILAILGCGGGTAGAAVSLCPYDGIDDCIDAIQADLQQVLDTDDNDHAQYCIAIRGLWTALSEACIQYLDEDTYRHCHDVRDVMDSLHSLAKSVSLLHETCLDFHCPEADPVQIDICLTDITSLSASLEQLCVSSLNLSAVHDTTMACLTPVLESCSFDVRQQWLERMRSMWQDLGSESSSAACKAFHHPSCGNVSNILEEIGTCARSHQLPEETVTLDEYCGVAQDRYMCLKKAVSDCSVLQDFYLFSDGTIGTHMQALGCTLPLDLSHNLEPTECTLRTSLECYSPLQRALGFPTAIRINNQGEYPVLSPFNLNDITTTALCRAINKVDVYAIRQCLAVEREKCTDDLTYDEAYIDEIDEYQLNGKLMAVIVISYYDYYLVEKIKTGICSSTGCGDTMNDQLEAMAKCTELLHLEELALKVVMADDWEDTSAPCRKLDDGLQCARDAVAGCNFLLESLTEQVHMIPRLTQAIGLCGLDLQLHFESCTEESLFKTVLLSECMEKPSRDLPALQVCNRLDAHIDCLAHWAKDCENTLAAHLDPYLPSFALTAHVYQCTEVNLAGAEITPRGCALKDTLDCFGPLMEAMGFSAEDPGALLNLIALDEYILENMDACSNFSQIDFDSMSKCFDAAQRDCRYPTMAANSPKAKSGTDPWELHPAKMERMFGMLCGTECANSVAHHRQLERCVAPPLPQSSGTASSPSLSVLTQQILYDNILGRLVSGDRCKALATRVTCLEEVAKVCSYFRDAVYQQLTGQEWRAIQTCDLDTVLALAPPEAIDPWPTPDRPGPVSTTKSSSSHVFSHNVLILVTVSLIMLLD